MFLLQPLFGDICTIASSPALCRVWELAAAQGAFQRGRSHYTESPLSLNFKAERGDLK